VCILETDGIHAHICTKKSIHKELLLAAIVYSYIAQYSASCRAPLLSPPLAVRRLDMCMFRIRMCRVLCILRDGCSHALRLDTLLGRPAALTPEPRVASGERTPEEQHGELEAHPTERERCACSPAVPSKHARPDRSPFFYSAKARVLHRHMHSPITDPMKKPMIKTAFSLARAWRRA
jgi:hypothetical protein